MKIQQFLNHHGIARNPFAEEDAQTDPVFKNHCIASTFHPAWDKVYGDPAEPATAIVFGERGSGKTAMRLQIARHLAEYNKAHPDGRSFLIHYDDLNPFLDRFRDRFHGRRRRADRMLAEWKLWDHMDSMLSLGVTQLVNSMLHARRDGSGASGDEAVAEPVGQLDRNQSRDLLLLAACYDQSLEGTYAGRWHRLRQKLRYPVWKSKLSLAGGIAATVAVAALIIGLMIYGRWSWITSYWMLYLAAILAGWGKWGWDALRNGWKAWTVKRHLRVGIREWGPLRGVLMRFSSAELSGQPLPNKDRSDDRYELLIKFQDILQTLGYAGIVVLVDRVDEPHLINGSADLMKALIWPMLDNKLLTHPGLGIKLMLPLELHRFVEQDGREFYQRARLDKQNVIWSFQWSGESLLDVANARLRACAESDATPALKLLFDASVTEQRLLESMRSLRVPRHLFKFLYRLLVAHTGMYTDDKPCWKISSETFESILAVYLRDQDAFDRGVGAG